MELKVDIINVFLDSTKCILCLELNDDLIAITDDPEENMVAILCQHFWFSSETIRNQSVCKSCWDRVEMFDQFYNQVELLYIDASSKPQTAENMDGLSESNLTFEACEKDSDLIVWKSEMDFAAEYSEDGSEHSFASCDVPKEDLQPEILDDSMNTKGQKQKNESLKGIEEDVLFQNHTKLSCPICDISATTFLKLMKHMRTEHKTAGYVNCCGKEFHKRSQLLDHVNSLGNNNSSKCDICQEEFSENTSLSKHNLKHNTSQTNVLECDRCNCKFHKKSQLDLHLKEHASDAAKEYLCSSCGRIFPKDKSLKSHFARMHNEPQLICEQCPERFESLTQFKTHQKHEHDSDASIRKQCKICSRWMKSADSLRKHMYRHKSSDKPNVCGICGKNAPNVLALRSHMSFVHRKQRIFECTVCDKAFKRAFALQEHMTVHTGNKLYSCAYCTRTFNSSANMHTHRKRVHKNEWEQSRRENEKIYESQSVAVEKIQYIN